MEEIENIKNELNEIKTARDSIKTALENEGETVTNDIRTYADTIPNVNKVKTVNSVEADENKNVQLDASKINIDDTAETKQTIKDTIEDILASLGSNAKVLFWDGNEVSSTDTEGLKVWTDLIHYIYAGDDNYAIIVGKIPDTMLGSSDSYRPLFVFGWEQVSGTITLKSINRRRAYVNSMEGVTTPYSYVYTLKLIYSGNQVRTVYKITETVSEYKSYLPAGDLSNEQDITPYIPEKDYQPTSKKYVDDEISKIEIPDYSIIETTVTEGYSKTYSLTKDGTEVGVKINIPKDLVVNKGSVKVVATAGTPYEGAVVGDKYLDIELNDPTQDHIYIPVKELVDVYTAGGGIEISADNVIKSKNSNLINGSAVGSIKGINAKSDNSTYTIGEYASAFGTDTAALGDNSHAEGRSTSADGHNAHAEGANSSARGESSHAEGNSTMTKGISSHAEGIYTVASTHYQHVQGRYNIEDTSNKYAHIVGNGSNGTARSNAHTVAWDGTGWFQGNVKVGGTSQDDTNAKNLATEDYVNNELEPVKTNIGLIQDTVGGIFYWDGKSSSDNPDNIQLWNNILTKHLEQDVLIYTTILSNYTDTGVITLSKGKLNLSTDGNKTLDIGFVGTKQSRNMNNTDISTKACRITLTITNGKVTNINSLNSISNSLGQYLETNYNYSTPYTPKYDGSPATKKYVDDKYNTLSVVEIVSADKEPGYTFSFGKLCDSVMVFLNGEKLIAQKSSSQTIEEYSYIENKTDNKITSVIFTNDFTITTGDRIEAILINPSDISTASEISESSDE